MESGLISFFQVTQCGLYRIRKGKDNELIEGKLHDTVLSVMNWTKGRELENTIPWDVSRLPTKSKIYCESVHYNPQTKDSLIVFWKGLGDDDGNVNGLLARSKVGTQAGATVTVDKKINGEDYIYGLPMYYWFIPELNLIASIKFPNSLTSLDAITDYIKKAVDYRIPHERRKVSESTHYNHFAKRDITQKNVTFEPETGNYSLKFQISAHTKELSANRVDVTTLAANITHIVTRDTISGVYEDRKDSSLKMWDIIKNVQKRKFFQKEIQVVEEVNLQPDELQKLLTLNQDIIDKKSVWNNIGFKTDGIDGNTKWFAKYVENKHITLDPKQLHDNIYYPASIVLTALTNRRQDILKTLMNAALKSVVTQDKVVGEN
jgi:hypothetical protein